MENNNVKKFDKLIGYSDFANKKELKKFYDGSISILLQDLWVSSFFLTDEPVDLDASIISPASLSTIVFSFLFLE